MQRLKHGHSEQAFTDTLQPTEQDSGKLATKANTANMTCIKTYIYSIFFHVPPNPGFFFPFTLDTGMVYLFFISLSCLKKVHHSLKLIKN